MTAKGCGGPPLISFKSRDVSISAIARFVEVFGIVIHYCFEGYGFGGWGKWGSEVRAIK